MWSYIIIKCKENVITEIAHYIQYSLMHFLLSEGLYFKKTLLTKTFK